MSKIVAVGRRKTSVARVFMAPGSGKMDINQRPLSDYFPFELTRMKVLEPFTVLGISHEQYDIHVNVRGGGITGQAEAVRMGIARALNEESVENNRPALKKAGLLTRDARKVERKKFGLKKARKSSQFSKR